MAPNFNVVSCIGYWNFKMKVKSKDLNEVWALYNNNVSMLFYEL